MEGDLHVPLRAGNKTCACLSCVTHASCIHTVLRRRVHPPLRPRTSRRAHAGRDSGTQEPAHASPLPCDPRGKTRERRTHEPRVRVEGVYVGVCLPTEYAGPRLAVWAALRGPEHVVSQELAAQSGKGHVGWANNPFRYYPSTSRAKPGSILPCKTRVYDTGRTGGRIKSPDGPLGKRADALYNLLLPQSSYTSSSAGGRDTNA